MSGKKEHKTADQKTNGHSAPTENSSGKSGSAPGFLLVVGFGTLTWTIWNGSFTWQSIVWGLVLSFIAFTLTNRYLLKSPYQEIFRIHPVVLFKYVVVLLYAIFESGIHAMYVTITGKIDIGVVDIPTEIRNPFHGSLVATAITLTPGTVTIDYKPGWYKVIWIESLETHPQKAGDMIKGRFENVLMRKNTSKKRRVL